MCVYLKFQTNKDELTSDNLQEWMNINLELPIFHVIAICYYIYLDCYETFCNETSLKFYMIGIMLWLGGTSMRALQRWFIYVLILKFLC